MPGSLHALKYRSLLSWEACDGTASNMLPALLLTMAPGRAEQSSKEHLARRKGQHRPFDIFASGIQDFECLASKLGHVFHLSVQLQIQASNIPQTSMVNCCGLDVL